MNYWGIKLEKDDNKKKDKMSIDDEKNTVEVQGNHIYFYNGVDFESALKINKALQDLTTKLTMTAQTNGFKEKPTIHLHINSFGGHIDAGTSIMDTILILKKEINVFTYVEGASASAATFISIVGTKRFITRHSRMLIHQITSATWGKYREIKDDVENFDKMMIMIKKFYNEFTSVPEKDLDEILDHDLWWDSKKCLELNLVDEII